MTEERVEDLLRRLAPQVLGAVVRRYGHFDTSEDATQEALLAAALQWPRDGVPERPLGWLVTVASRRLTDLLRNEAARRRREEAVARQVPLLDRVAPPVDQTPAAADDTLVLLHLCCHPSLSPASQIALTLRAVGGLTTSEVARAFLVPEATMTRRITRAKQRIVDSGLGFRLPPAADRAAGLAAVLHVLYLIFNEGYSATSGASLQRTELSAEAIRLARLVHRQLPEDSEVTGLLALMLLTDARSPARTGPRGELVAMADQDRSRWKADAIAEGVALVTAALPRGPTGPYQLQAAIAAVHDEAATAADTDWPQILALYEVLLQVADNPVVRLNHAVATAMVSGPDVGLQLIDRLEDDHLVVGDYRLAAVRGHLWERLGARAAARACYRAASEQCGSLAHQRYLNERAAALADEAAKVVADPAG